jgi:hypothetical protein
MDDGGGVGEAVWLGWNVQGRHRVASQVVELNRRKLKERGLGPWPWVAAIKPSDTTTNQNLVLVMGGTWRRQAIAAGSMGGAFHNRLAAANEATKNKKIKYVVALNGYQKS